MSTMWLAVITAVAFLMAAFFAGAETAFLAADRVRLRHMARHGDRRAQLLLRYLGAPEYFLSIVLVGTNLGVIGGTATFTAIMVRWMAESGATAATVILVPTLMIFQEILPKGVFLYYAERLAIASIYPMRVFAIVLFPIIKVFSETSKLLARAFGVRRMDRKITMSMEELLFHLEGSGQEGLISDDTMLLARRAVELMDIRVGDVMVPLDRVVMAPLGQELEQYDRLFHAERFSRIPLYAGVRSQVAGILSIQNLLRAHHGPTRDLKIEPAFVVDADSPITEVLLRMKKDGTHMAMVKEKSGTIVGMATLEDVLERLVGAIADEFH